MSKDVGIRRVAFNQAKGNLSSFMSDVVRKHALSLLERGQVEREELLAISVEDLLPGLRDLRLDARVSFGEGGSVIARLPQFGLVVSGNSFESGIDALCEALEEYCSDFFTDFDFYRHTDRIAHLPFLLRFALTPVEERRSLLVEEPKGAQLPVQPREAFAIAH